MSSFNAGPEAGRAFDHESSVGMTLLTLGTVILQSRRRIVVLAIVLGVFGLLTGLFSPRQYTSTATILPQASDGSQSGSLIAAASQFGLRVPTGGSGGSVWGTAVYVELLNSRSLLEPIVRDSLVVSEDAGRKKALLDVLDANGPTASLRVNDGVGKLLHAMSVTELRSLGGVKIKVTTQWPSVSQAVARRLIDALNRFNLQTRRSQASAERRFVEARALEAEISLRDAEEKLAASMERNRIVTGSPQLSLERDRLQRNVILRQQVYTSLLQSRDEARIREVRDTPVITVLEEPGLPAVSEPRRSIQRGVIGAFAGALLGALIAFVSFRSNGARTGQSEATRAFFDQLSETTEPVRRLFRRER